MKQVKNNPLLRFSAVWYLKDEGNREFLLITDGFPPFCLQWEHQVLKHCFCLGPSCLCLACVNEKWISRDDKLVLLLMVFQVSQKLGRNKVN